MDLRARSNFLVLELMIVDELDNDHNLYYYPYLCTIGHTLKICLALEEKFEFYLQAMTIVSYEGFLIRKFPIMVEITSKK